MLPRRRGGCRVLVRDERGMAGVGATGTAAACTRAQAKLLGSQPSKPPTTLCGVRPLTAQPAAGTLFCGTRRLRSRRPMRPAPPRPFPPRSVPLAAGDSAAARALPHAHPHRPGLQFQAGRRGCAYTSHSASNPLLRCRSQVHGASCCGASPAEGRQARRQMLFVPPCTRRSQRRRCPAGPWAS